MNDSSLKRHQSIDHIQRPVQSLNIYPDAVTNIVFVVQP